MPTRAVFAMAVLLGGVAFGQRAAEPMVDRVLVLDAAATPQDIVDMQHALSFIAEVPQTTFDRAQGALLFRATEKQMTAVEWVKRQVDELGIAQAPASRLAPFEIAGRNGTEAVRAIGFGGPMQKTNFIEIAAAVRTVAEVTYEATFLDRNTMILRGPADSIELADWLATEMNGPAGKGPGVHERAVAGSGESARVFALNLGEPVRGLGDFYKTARAAGIDRLWLCYRSKAVAVRGNADQIAATERLIRELKLYSER